MAEDEVRRYYPTSNGMAEYSHTINNRTGITHIYRFPEQDKDTYEKLETVLEMHEEFLEELRQKWRGNPEKNHATRA